MAMGGHGALLPVGWRVGRERGTLFQLQTGMNQGAGRRKHRAAGGGGQDCGGGGAAQPDTGSRSRERCEVPKGSIAILISYESILTCHGQLGRLTPELQDLINGLSNPYLWQEKAHKIETRAERGEEAAVRPQPGRFADHGKGKSGMQSAKRWSGEGGKLPTLGSCLGVGIRCRRGRGVQTQPWGQGSTK